MKRTTKPSSSSVPASKPAKKEFTFWKENRRDSEYKLTIEEIKVKYLAFLKLKELSWIKHYDHRTVVVFITGKEGLNSSVDAEDYRVIETMLAETRDSLLSNPKKK
jgi:hypothetical protein